MLLLYSGWPGCRVQVLIAVSSSTVDGRSSRLQHASVTVHRRPSPASSTIIRRSSLVRRPHGPAALVPLDTLAGRHHRLRGSASPVLTATHHSYGSPRLSDFFFRLTPGGQTPQPILTQTGSNDVDSRKDDTFVVKIATFHTL